MTVLKEIMDKDIGTEYSLADAIEMFTGREWDGDTGLYYYRARYYSPEMSRFISEDPIGLAGGINQYAYVGNNPTNLVDPEGLRGTIRPPRTPKPKIKDKKKEKTWGDAGNLPQNFGGDWAFGMKSKCLLWRCLICEDVNANLRPSELMVCHEGQTCEWREVTNPWELLGRKPVLISADWFDRTCYCAMENFEINTWEVK